MTLTHDQAHDLLEGYALWSLDERERAAVDRHLAECERCRETARDLEYVAAAIPESVVDRAPSARLRERVLAAAAGDARAPRRRFALPLRPAWMVSLVLLASALVSGGVAVRSQLELARVQAERDELWTVALNVSEGARWWYMAGVASFEGSEGTLIDAKRSGEAYVLFHDLKPIGADQRYAIWLIRPDGGWVRAANFTPSGGAVQRVGVPLSVSDFVQCAVTIETRDSGAPQGTLAMESRVFGQ